MAFPNIFEKDTTHQIIERINNLQPATAAKWGKMDVSQMLAHCNVTYEMVYDNVHPKPNGFMRFLLKSMVKSKVVGEQTYPQNSRTAPQFIIASEKDFEAEKNRLVAYLQKTQELGSAHFDGKESLSFGKLNTKEWNNMFYKHLDHHLNQFGA